MELKLSNLNRRHVKNTNWPKEKKLQVVAQYLALGNLRLVSATTGVDYGLIRQWKLQPWWKEFEIEIRNTENLTVDNKLTRIVEKSLEAVADRLEHGEAFFNQKTGVIERKPVVMRDAARVATDLLTKRELLRGNATNRTEAVAIPMDEQLKKLAQEFARMVNGKSPEVIDVEMVERIDGQDIDNLFDEGEDDAIHDERETGLQEGSGEVHEQAFGDQEEDGTERS